MKTTFKKSVLAFLTCVLALAFALTGCSGGGKDPKANFVGSWQYSVEPWTAKSSPMSTWICSRSGASTVS